MRNTFMMGWLAFLLLGCASMASDSRLMKFEDLSRRYEKALSWSEYELAYRLVTTPEAPKLEVKPYSAFKVTNYQAVHHTAYDGGKRVRRLVKMQYLLLSRMSEQSLALEEEWFFSETSERWFLQSGFPVFKQ